MAARGGFTGPLLALALLLPCTAVSAQVKPGVIQGANVQQWANGVLGLMSYRVAPNATTGSLSIDNGSTANADLFLTQLGGSFTWSLELPVYLEGNAAYAPFDPVLLATDGTEHPRAPTRWNSVALVFLDDGELHAYGLCGALMLDYEKFSPEADHDLEFRHTKVDLRTHGSTSEGVEGRAKTESLSIWARRRVPIGWGQVWERPVRYIHESAFTRFYGSQAELGITHISSLEIGLELDASALDRWATRWRTAARFRFGPGP